MFRFDEEKHEYTLNGVVLPNVTEIVTSVLFPDKYSFVHPDVMERSAEFGKNVHKALDLEFPDLLTDEEYHCYNEAVKILSDNAVKVLRKETKIYSQKGIAGTYDLYAEMNGKKVLIDYKTTSTFMPDSASWQLSLYKMMLAEYGDEVTALYVIHIPKRGKGKLLKVDIKNQIELEWLIKTYKERTTK